MRRLLFAVILVLLAATTVCAGSNGFRVENFSYWYNGSGQTVMIGELVNGSDKSYTSIIFNLSIFDPNSNKLIDVIPLAFMEIRARERRSFKAYQQRKYPDGFKYRLEFNMGA